eukprot:m.248226 g.248226  ORF g.248226 m.248226 type:complete len:196 (-) comp57263_c0_seq1:174-761(-)
MIAQHTRSMALLLTVMLVAVFPLSIQAQPCPGTGACRCGYVAQEVKTYQADCWTCQCVFPSSSTTGSTAAVSTAKAAAVVAAAAAASHASTHASSSAALMLSSSTTEAAPAEDGSAQGQTGQHGNVLVTSNFTSTASPATAAASPDSTNVLLIPILVVLCAMCAAYLILITVRRHRKYTRLANDGLPHDTLIHQL